MISYEIASVNELIEDFHNAIDDFLEVCKSENIKPESAYKDTFNVCISPELHKQIAILTIKKSFY